MNKGRCFIGRLNSGADLLTALTDFCVKEQIQLGVFSVIGAVKSARLGYYRQEEKDYSECVDLTKNLEIATCSGNISLANGKIFVHAHIILADHQGQCYGGHLMNGAEIFAAEYFIQELQGPLLERTYDSITGLNLWSQ